MSIKEALMQGQGLTEEEAKHSIKEMKIMVLEGEDPEEVLYENGLEPDYIFEIL
jgi:hypothetical protein